MQYAGLVYDRSRVVRFILESIAKVFLVFCRHFVTFFIFQADAIILDSVWDGLGLDMSNKPFDTSFDAVLFKLFLNIYISVPHAHISGWLVL